MDKDVYRFYLIKMIILDLNFSPATVVYVQERVGLGYQKTLQTY